ncbi:protein-lysine N-methyltransferase [Aspergillus melleus]|uniref:protein-lysine N-methyltransferase n=1 Tax=Aspergillus melleus TaxID=138277 RepID=UPI001E8CD511|nr:uncharacterized protein LDX57_008821 [Aspergillus melleus]KAH8431162.1 hypothetical protein LDX57_008821 [Aspergillus melleus]
MTSPVLHHVDLLTRQFHEQVDPPLLPLPQGRDIVHPAVQSAIYAHMFDETSVWPIPPVNYQTRVLKMILSRIEEAISDPEEDEIHPDLISAWATLISQPKPSSTIHQAQQLTYIKYTAPWPPPSSSSSDPPRTIITSESRGLILAAGTTGFRTWEASLHLATYLSSTPAGGALVQEKRVIELGAGTGLVSMFCAKYLRPRRVVATDREPALIENMRDCAGRNCLENRPGDGEEQGQFSAAVWEWGTPLDGESMDTAAQQDGEPISNDEKKETAATPTFDVALGADLIYDTDLIPLLISTVHDLFQNHGIKEFVIAATLRNQETFGTFLRACEENSFTAEQVSFESPSREQQTGFFHSTDVPIQMYRITETK